MDIEWIKIVRHAPKVTSAIDLCAFDENFFPSVAPERLGLALTVFVTAANKTLLNTDRRISTDPQNLEPECELLFANLSPEAQPPFGKLTAGWTVENTLGAALLGLWRHFQSDALRASLCARVLSFYYLMVHTRGAALVDWIKVCPEHPEAVMLHPAVVEALSLVPLNREGRLSQSLFLSSIRTVASASLN